MTDSSYSSLPCCMLVFLNNMLALKLCRVSQLFVSELESNRKESACCEICQSKCVGAYYGRCSKKHDIRFNLFIQKPALVTRESEF